MPVFFVRQDLDQVGRLVRLRRVVRQRNPAEGGIRILPGVPKNQEGLCSMNTALLG
ncbi:hypothetical protein D3OALGA1CA_147 [Olavius algarvensis associated proteobacterium Delta 3]|nr:hypothetical protein D3OALGA1CA_147 [Olavius algarvensis associated proteobacterium Delta 3]